MSTEIDNNKHKKTFQLNISFDKSPHIIINHPQMTNDAEIVFRNLFKILKDKSYCTYSDEALCEASRIKRKTLNKCLDLLESIGAIIKIGLRQNRKFHRGMLLISSHKNITPAPNAYVNNNNTETSLNTPAPNADAWAPNADAWAPNADILRLTSKNSTTKTENVVVVISESKDKTLKSTYEKHKENLQSDEIKNVDDMLNYCKWNLEKAKSEGIEKDGRFNQIIKFLIAGTLRVDPRWRQNINLERKQRSNKILLEYQEYATRIKSDIHLGLISADTRILNFDEWNKINEK